MTRIVIATAVALAAVAAAGTAIAQTSGGPPCAPKVKTIKGTRGVVYCGPATATVRAGGKTYTFKGGFCQQSKAAGGAFELWIGTIAPLAKGNAGLASFHLLVGKNLPNGTVSAWAGGKQVANNLVNVPAHAVKQGTFKPVVTGSGPGENVTGSWNCHGPIYQAP